MWGQQHPFVPDDLAVLAHRWVNVNSKTSKENSKQARPLNNGDPARFFAFVFSACELTLSEVPPFPHHPASVCQKNPPSIPCPVFPESSRDTSQPVQGRE